MNILPRKQSAISRNVFSDLSNIHNELDRLFDFSFGWPEKFPVLSEKMWIPAMDVEETKDSVLVKADLPGLKKEEIDINVHEGVLTIKGEKKKEEERKDKGFIRSERYYGSFYRELSLPASVDEAKVKASYKDGVLEIVIPKKEEAKQPVKRITVD